MHLQQRFKVADKCLQVAHFSRQRSPCWRLSLLTEPSDQSSVCFVGLGAREVTLSISFDDRWVDDTHYMTCLKKVSRQSFTISPSGFHAEMSTCNLLLLQPGRKLS